MKCNCFLMMRQWQDWRCTSLRDAFLGNQRLERRSPSSFSSGWKSRKEQVARVLVREQVGPSMTRTLHLSWRKACWAKGQLV